MATTRNEDLPVGAIDEFVETAKKRGVYGTAQATNLKFSLNLAIQTAKNNGVDISTISVGALERQVPELLDVYGGQNPASAATVSTYKARASRLIKDFIAWNGGDFMKWKSELARKPSGPQKKKAKAPIESSNGAGSNGEATNQRERVHELRAPRNRIAKLVLPEPLTTDDIEKIWSQLDKLKPYLESQAKIDDEDADDDLPDDVEAQLS